MIFLLSFDQATVIFSAFFRIFLFLGKKQSAHLHSGNHPTRQGRGWVLEPQLAVSWLERVSCAGSVGFTSSS